ncbi:hypothetical protein Pmar_PMAR012343 [Perkinsus marinus ATCC 50983]|uniref:Uncharacterized protein n=1 Tax=Perkinsus marinus (strain ATCC 50983 / TXsc) TaxID=423536 RepID=C5K732_PERM5|nr:hypothetical protein Pmar_PMAR012343 [Perkinsus marinus ATCC 50983]EER19367.1 hypothetical protein Pmar_PMAR012343 [Perkinsus marinus ATCC 50983]|eukprot:XP_002787571.1 hypothetical protein Pmar_PMAR012343 [Perkinsus marinus ATCC 50983]
MTVPEGANTNESQIHKAGDEEEEEEEKNLEDLIKKAESFLSIVEEEVENNNKRIATLKEDYRLLRLQSGQLTKSQIQAISTMERKL